MMLIAGISAFAGSQLLTKIHNSFMKPVLLVVLIIVAVYSYSKKISDKHKPNIFP